MLAQRDDDLTDSSRELNELDPYCGPRGELRVQGRLKYLKKLGVETSRPLIMKGKSEWTRTLILHVHESTKHMAGTEQVLAELRKRFWITKGREAVRKVLRECVKCRRLRRHTVTQQMGLIAELRVPDEASYVFQFTAVDAAGPFFTKMPRGHARRKRYMLVFTCCTFRCTHLELLTALDTDSFLLAFERFIARRGRPRVLAMDNGTNFVGGASELVKAWQDLQTDTIRKRYEITFKFNVPLAPHRNGLVERIVGSAKRALLHILKPEVAVTDEELMTAFAMVEAVLNARPLTYVGSDFKDLEPLTPEHFLGTSNAQALGLSSLTSSHSFTRRIRCFREIMQHFIVRFQKEYVPGLQPRQKWQKQMENLKPGAIVTVFDPNSPKYWPLAVVSSVKKGKDGLVRTLKYRLSNGKEYERDVRYVSLLFQD